jgi:hypothetical protein
MKILMLVLVTVVFGMMNGAHACIKEPTALADSSLWGYAVDKYSGNAQCVSYPDDSAARADAQSQASEDCGNINYQFSAYETDESKTRKGVHTREYFPSEFGSPEHTLCETMINFGYECH